MRAEQEKTDQMYEKLINAPTAEMDIHFKKIANTPKSKKAYRHIAREWWDDETEELWNAMHTAEKSYLGTNRRDTSYKAKYTAFVHAQQTFDKVSKAKKRRTLRNKVQDIEKANTSDLLLSGTLLRDCHQDNVRTSHGKLLTMTVIS